LNELPVVSIQNLYKSFIMNDGSKLDVLEDINLNVNQNELVGLIGYSGCGKTTLLRTICGFEKPDAGHILIDGKNHVLPQKNVLMLFQDFNQLLPWKTVLGNVIHPLLATKTVVTKEEAKKRALKRLNDVGLSEFINSYPHQLSGGMKQRTTVARALALQPRVLLMDEPFAALDNITRHSLQLLTRHVCEKYGVTAIFVTHSVEEAVIMADRIIVMRENPGRIEKTFENSNRQSQDEEARATLSAEILALLDKNRSSAANKKNE